MSSVGDLLMVQCDKHMYVYHLIWIMREFLCEEELEKTYCCNVYSNP